ncbi:MAG: [FeFe] hydrogenase H-cluster radical SAM maturase HydE [Ruminococcaceae bacterium]|nr:[FeFe] hydrogenase H-cluster radical SAM maturase HydE [Oscillospiraceae bacterium]
MRKELFGLADRLAREHRLELDEYRALIDGRAPEITAYLADLAVQARKRIYGNTVYIRGLIEIGNVCKNDCLYCGIRRGNTSCERYRLSHEEILACCREGYTLGFRTFVLQGGEDPFWTDDRLCLLLRAIKQEHPDVAVTLSLGERSRESYARLKEAGADRYLLRHETADATHYAKLHPKELSFDNRMRCLTDLKSLGYQVGCGFMVGSPYQTSSMLARDLQFVEQFAPDMCGIGPFIPQSDTPFRHEPAGSAELTCYLLSILRLIRPNFLLPATTALGTIHPGGREMGILSGANVVMPNLSPASVRAKYALYDNKLSDGSESAQCKDELTQRMRSIGYEVVTDRGDVKPIP